MAVNVAGWAVTAKDVDRTFTSVTEAEQAAVAALRDGWTVRLIRYWEDGLVEYCHIIVFGEETRASPWQVYVKQPARRTT